MKNPRLEAARAYLRQTGKELPDATILGLLDAVTGLDSAAYEVGDFIHIRFGMGEAGHGTVKAVEDNGYRIEVWTPPAIRATEEPWSHFVGNGDIIGLSNVKEAQAYWTERS